MRIYLNKNSFKREDIPGYTEIFLLIPFLKKDIYYSDILPVLGQHNESLFTKMFYTGKQIITETDITNCDFSLVPFKYDYSKILDILLEAKKNNKKTIGFYNDDNSQPITISQETILFRTSLFKSQQHFNERVFPALIPDHFINCYNCNDKSISFCGSLTELRHNVIKQIKLLPLKTDFIFRAGFWAPEINCKIKARHEYNNNLLANRYALCMRGAGNFSYRFYEALSFGRVPILIDTDTALPFSNIIDWNKHVIFIKQNEIENLPELIKQDTRSMEENRNLWVKYLSVEGYAQNFIKDI
jgi:hypothetical protein